MHLRSLIYLSFLLQSGFAQTLRSSISAPYVALDAYTSNQQGVFSFTGNQAALASLKSFNAGIYGERRFMLAENSAYAIAAALPTSKGNFGLQLNYAGYANFNEKKLGIAYARGLGKKVDIGLQFNHYGYTVAGYGSASTINFEAGVLINFSDKVIGGLHVYNPIGGKLGKSEDEKLASVYKLGIGYDASQNFFVAGEIIKEENRAVNVIGGIQYQFMKQFFVRAGFVSDTGSGFGGAGIAWKNIRLDLSANYHPQLGLSPGLLLFTNFKDKQK